MRKKVKKRFNKQLLLFVLVVIAWWSSRNWLYAGNIECYSQFGFCNDEILQKLSWLNRTPLLFPLPGRQVTSSLSEIPQIKSVRLYRRLPSTLIVSINLRRAIGLLGPQVLGLRSVADEDGVIIGQQEKSPLPQLIDDTTYQTGDKLDSTRSQALKVLSRISAVTASPALGKIEKSNLLVTVSPSIVLLLDLNNLPPNWDRTLQLILDRSKIQVKVPKQIDLRFSSPILTF